MPEPVITITTAVNYLREKEWSLGNNQCYDCYGNEPNCWAPHPCVPTKEHEGHTIDCPLAIALKSLGQPVVFKTKGELYRRSSRNRNR